MDAQYHLHSLDSLDAVVREFSLSLTPSRFNESQPTILVENRVMGEYLRYALCDAGRVLFDFSPRQLPSLLSEILNDFSVSQERPINLLAFTLRIFQSLQGWYHQRENDATLQPLWEYVDEIRGDSLNSSLSKSLWSVSEELANHFYTLTFDGQPLLKAWSKSQFLEGEPYQEIPQRWLGEIWRRLKETREEDEESIEVLQGEILDKIESSQAEYTGKIRHLVIVGNPFFCESIFNLFSHLSRWVTIDHFLFSSDLEIVPPPLSNWAEWDQAWQRVFLSTKSLQREPPPSPSRPFPDLTKERIELISGAGPRREVEICKDKLLLFYQKKSQDSPNSPPPLSRIAIVSEKPDLYFPLVETVFAHISEEEPTLPISSLYKTVTSGEYFQGVEKLFNLAGSRFLREEIFELFLNPSFSQKFDLDENTVAFWLHLAEECHIHWGFDAEHKLSLGLDTSPRNTWQSGFHRLLSLFNQDPFEDERGILKSQSQQRLVGELIHSVRSLFNDIYPLGERELTPAQWLTVWERIFEKYLSPQNPEESKAYLSLKQEFFNLGSLGSCEGVAIGFSAFRSLFENQLATHRSAAYSPRGILLGTLEEVQGVPFDLIYLLGLDETFLKRTTHPSYDVQELIPSPLLRTRESQQRSQLLRLVLNSPLILSYSGIDPLSGKELPPSVVVEDLAKSLGLSVEEWRESHPLQPFDSGYFDKETSLTSFSTLQFKNAFTLQAREETSEKGEPFLLAERGEKSVEIRELYEMLLDPLSSLKHSLKLDKWSHQLPLRHLEESIEPVTLPFGGTKDFIQESFPSPSSRISAPPSAGGSLSVEKFLEERIEEEAMSEISLLVQSDVSHLEKVSKTLEKTLQREEIPPLSSLKKRVLLLRESKPLSLGDSLLYHPPLEIPLQRGEDDSKPLSQPLAVVGRLEPLYQKDTTLYLFKIAYKKSLFPTQLENALSALILGSLYQASPLCVESHSPHIVRDDVKDGVKEGREESVKEIIEEVVFLTFEVSEKKYTTQRFFLHEQKIEKSGHKGVSLLGAKSKLTRLISLLFEHEQDPFPYFTTLLEPLHKKALYRDDFNAEFDRLWRRLMQPPVVVPHGGDDLQAVRREARWLFPDDSFVLEKERMYQMVQVLHEIL